MSAVSSGISTPENPACATFLVSVAVGRLFVHTCAVLSDSPGQNIQCREDGCQWSEATAVTASLHQPEDGCFSFNLP